MKHPSHIKTKNTYNYVEQNWDKCPVCEEYFAWWDDPHHRSETCEWKVRGGGMFVCRDCAKNRIDEIKNHNAIINRMGGE